MVRQNDDGFVAEMLRLFAELSKVSGSSRSLSKIGRFREVKREIDARQGLVRSVRYRRSELEEERRWIESDVRGFERALVLVGQTGDVPSQADGRGSDSRLRDKLDARMGRLAELDDELGVMDHRLRSILSEIQQLQAEALKELRHALELAEEEKRAADALRRQRLVAQRREMGEVDSVPMWSPMPVYGYRVWLLGRDGYYGARERWRTPELTATCSVEGDVPHTDGRCAEVAFGCGIYAAKSLEPLMDEVGCTVKGRFAIGLVALGGKVVEHDRGYRAENAAVRVLVVANRGKLRVVDVDLSLRDLFENPSTVDLVASTTLPDPDNDGGVRTTIKDYLEERAERIQTWT